MTVRTKGRWQRGAASLLIALVLMMCLTIVTLSLAGAHLGQRRIDSEAAWQERLLQAADAGLVTALGQLEGDLEALPWKTSGEGRLSIADITVDSRRPGIRLGIRLGRAALDSPFVRIEALASADDDPELQVRASRYARPLTILAPAGETAPPLVVNGCLRASARTIHLRPAGSDTRIAGDAAWLNAGNGSCHTTIAVDSHRGGIRTWPMDEDLWSTIFSIDRKHFAQLAREQRALPPLERRYWMVEGSRGYGGLWRSSLGRKERPVALYFTADSGCPRFSAGVRVHGVVFIDGNCPGPLAPEGLEIFGTLAVNGDLDLDDSPIRLTGPGAVEDGNIRFRFPVLRSVWVPGSWKDF